LASGQSSQTKQVPGELIYVPLGSLLLLPATTLHAGGMKAPLPRIIGQDLTHTQSNIISQHPRLHFYIFPSLENADYTGGNSFLMSLELQKQLCTKLTHFSQVFVHSPELQYTREAPGQLAVGLFNDVSPIASERVHIPK
jgi:hypothetical protein